jgi:hemoglobin
MATQTLFQALGGRAGVGRLVDDFYARVERDAGFRAIYPEDLAPGRAKLKLFLEQWLGGPAVYSERFGHPRLRRRHFPFVIDEKAAGTWLRYMREASQATGVPPEAEKTIFERLAPLAHHMANAHEEVPRAPLSETYLT